MTEQTYKHRSNYPTGGFCIKKEQCQTYLLSSNLNICNNCYKYDLFNKGVKKMSKNKEKIYKIMASHFSIKEEDINDETLLEEDLGADDLDIVELIMTLEEEFEIEISDEDSNKFIRVEDIVKYIEANI